jgi:hypothetical protein
VPLLENVSSTANIIKRTCSSSGLCSRGKNVTATANDPGGSVYFLDSAMEGKKFQPQPTSSGGPVHLPNYAVLRTFLLFE